MTSGPVLGERVAQRSSVRAILIFALCLGATGLVPARASAVTVDQILALSKAGVSEPVILALIDRDKTILPVEPDDLPALKRQGLSDAVILAMLKSGREEGEAAARAEAASSAARLVASLSTAPDVLIVGHGPERPITAHYGYDYYSYYPFYPFYSPYYPAVASIIPGALPFAVPAAPQVAPSPSERLGCTAPRTPITRFVGTRSTFAICPR